jgi:hypothetical protein
MHFKIYGRKRTQRICEVSENLYNKSEDEIAQPYQGKAQHARHVHAIKPERCKRNFPTDILDWRDEALSVDFLNGERRVLGIKLHKIP